MPVVLSKSRPLKPSPTMREIRYRNVEKNGIELAKGIAKEFGKQSKKMKPKKFLMR